MFIRKILFEFFSKIGFKDTIMALEEDDFIKMGAYVQEHLSEWLSEISFTKPLPIYEVELLERIPRVEKD